MVNDLERLYSLRGAAPLCGYKPRTLRQMCYDGHLKYKKTKGGHFRIPESEVRRMAGVRPPPENRGAVVYARVSSAENKNNLDSQARRIVQYCAANGWKVLQVVKEIASGINDRRPKLHALISTIREIRPAVLVVEHKDRLARIGAPYIEAAIEPFGCRLEVINEADDEKQDLMNDLIAIITSFCARYYGLRRAKRKTERILEELRKNGDHK